MSFALVLGGILELVMASQTYLHGSTERLVVFQEEITRNTSCMLKFKS